ncbi:MAG: cysteine--tRNA ligase [Gemmataceae bacterium]|nr:cysteine--tRNA ligase [Gemmataceae bacterium]
MALRVYNTLTQQKEPFQTMQPGKVGIYVCGPTVYKPSHVGHMVGPVIFDTVKRYLQYQGYQVTWVVNITDVDDKLIVRARELNTTVKDLAEKMTADYVDCLKKLNVTGIDLMPRATEHIAGMIEMMQGLIDKGYAYPAGGDVYFDVTKDPDYGKLCNRDPEQLEAGARIEVSDRKRNPGDFALWKGAKPGEPKWDSPWGPGRPGWHIECSAMSMKLLGKTLDIHGGGLDLQFPHHENELAQSESYTDQPFATYWMHNGLMRIRKQAGKVGGRPAAGAEGETEKMGGSLNNAINVAEVLAQHEAETVRFLLLATHYRSPIEWGDERLQEVRRSLDGFYRFFERYQRITGQNFYDLAAPTKHAAFKEDGNNKEFLAQVSKHRGAFLELMEDDFNTGGATGTLYELLTTLNRFADTQQLEGGKTNEQAVCDLRRGAEVLRELSQILGLFHQPLAARTGGNDQLVSGLMQLLIDLRAEARKTKNFALGDQIRKRLGELNVTLEDRPGGTGWRIG